MHLIEVSFKGNRKDFFLWEQEEAPPSRAAVIVDADRGEDLGYVHALGELATKRNGGTPHGYGAAGTRKKARRLATADDVARARELREQDDDARRRAAERVRANDLAMKLSDAEWQWDRKKLTLYFTAEKRVDFRTLVRELASMFRARIELKQIGVRDEAKRLDGIGRCGRQYCSASWLPELRPVNLGVAKDQRLSLNPSQISGACGRLMCCLRYEHEFYVQSRKRFPKEGRNVRTAKGDEKVISNDIFRERVTLRGVDGELRTITLVELRTEAETAGSPLPVAAAAAALSSILDDLTDLTDLTDARDGGDRSDATEAVLESDEEVEVIAEVLVADPEERRTRDRRADDREANEPQGNEHQANARQPSVATDVSVPAAEGLESSKASDPPNAPVVEPTAVEAAAPPASVEARGGEGDRERRPHRRRGRRGGRRNRGGRGDGGDSDGGDSAGGDNTSEDSTGGNDSAGDDRDTGGREPA
ncbi:MAG TPA: regulatory iron-sulfur-containing complex subunit RicT [Gemmatimonadaceae bacterium]|nr:regulatory iron-sulfur-containing complex subunit RicT [Gemmatimonadaceae bacterium]